jgi:hypothetical protein
MKAKVAEMNAEQNINGPELLVAMFLSIPELSQAGTSKIAPPIPRHPPVNPAANPKAMPTFIFF